jgi:microcin C transport system substrate-binding protein
MMIFKTVKIVPLISLVFFVLFSCSDDAGTGTGERSQDISAIEADEKAISEEVRPDFSSPQVADENLKIEGLPEELLWYTSHPGVFGSSRAKEGGEETSALSEFPQTFRTVGPNSNGGFRSYLLSGGALVGVNPETNEWMPQLATHWAFSSDKKTVYFKLNEAARFNDGEKITSEDYLFMLEMMRSQHIQAPWYNDYYTNSIIDVKAYGDYIISVTGNTEREGDDLLNNLSLSPRPKHFYKGVIDENWVDTYQWVYEPTAGPYRLSSFKKGETITFEKVDGWWGYVYDYNKYRYNIDKLTLKVITGGLDIQKQYFLNGEIDSFGLIIPKEWADSEKEDIIKKGYADRHYSFYVPLTGVSGIVLNTQAGIFKSPDVRKGLYYAINMDKMIATVLRGEYSRYHNIGLAHVFAGINFDDDTIRKPEFDPEKAAELFSNAGYKTIGPDGIRVNDKGERLSFELIYPASHHTERLSVLKEEAKKSGLEIVLNNMTEGAFTVLLDKKHEAFFITMSTTLTPSPWQYFHSDNAKEQTNNFYMIADEELDRLTLDYKNEGNLEKRAELSRAVQRRVHDLALIIPSYTVPYTRSTSWKWFRFPSWLNTKFSSSFIGSVYDSMIEYNGYGWIDEEIKKEVIQAKIKGEVFEPRTYIDETNKL